jgi:peptidoglycan/LPS O-acetylase OafA/YrhL
LRTFDQILNEHDGAGPGFDLLRLALALAILASHCSGITGDRGILGEIALGFQHLFAHGGVIAPHDAISNGGNAANVIINQPTGWGQPVARSHVPMFFALSGFLVTGSAYRTKRVLPFLALRFFRIFPALCVEVALSAIIIGGIFTTLPLSDYYSSSGFFTYFGNIIGLVHMFLPGVHFAKDSVVNANLWTLPSEFHCYLILAALILIGAVFNRTLMTGLFIFTTFALVIANVFFGFDANERGPLTGDVLVYCFYVGLIAYLWRDQIPYNVWLFLGATVVTYPLMFSDRTIYIYPILLGYMTVFIGLTNFPKSKLLQSGDYSYGIYLYGFPITQVLVTAVPALRTNIFVLIAAAFVCTGLFAFLSWHLVEKRFLRLRRFFSARSAKIAEELHPDIGGQTKDGANVIA